MNAQTKLSILFRNYDLFFTAHFFILDYALLNPNYTKCVGPSKQILAQVNYRVKTRSLLRINYEKFQTKLDVFKRKEM